jgi:hypothetical protein
MRHYRHPSPKAQRRAESRRLGYAAWRADDEAARRAIHPAPPDLPPGSEWAHWQLSGLAGCADVLLLTPLDKGRRRSRSDQFTLVVDGVVIGERLSMTAIMRHMRENVLFRQDTRAQRRETDRFAPPCQD